MGFHLWLHSPATAYHLYAYSVKLPKTDGKFIPNRSIFGQKGGFINFYILKTT